MLLTIVLFLLLLTFLVFIHEMGHFLTAYLFKIKIEEFGFGFPPKVRTLFHWKGIPFTLNWIPIGGFVRMEGEDGEVPAHVQTTHAQFQPFYVRPKWQRLIVILAGPAVNFVFGILAFTIIFTKFGIPVALEHPRIESVMEQSPGAQAGLQPGDEIISIIDQGKPVSVTSAGQFTQWALSKPDQDIVITIRRGGAQQEVQIHTRDKVAIERKEGAVGVGVADEEPRFYPWYEMPIRSAIVGTQLSLEFSKQILVSLGGMASQIFSQGKVPTDLAGPIGIVDQVHKEKIFNQGFFPTLNFLGLFSINLAIMNILPIPALDGGRIVLIVVEAIVGRKRVGKVEGYLNTIGFVFLMLLIALISLKDVITLVRR